MSPLRREALEVAGAALRRQPALRGLSPRERREVEALATAVALRVVDALELLDAYIVPTSSREPAPRRSTGT